MKYNRYHTDLKFAVITGNLERELLQLIPKSTLHNWKAKSIEFIQSFISTQNKISLDLETARLVQSIIKNQRFIKMLVAYLKVKNTIIKILKLKSSIDTKQLIVNTILRTKEVLGLLRTLKYFHISKSTFHLWVNQIQFQCNSSIEKLCIRRFVNQISIPEIKVIRSLLDSMKNSHWPLASIWGHGIKNQLIHISLSTFYKYVKMIAPEFGKRRFKRRRKDGFITTHPNQVWHCDITKFLFRFLFLFYVKKKKESLAKKKKKARPATFSL